MVEILVSISIFFLAWMATVTAITASRYLSVYVKHKAQAIYYAQRILEEQRRTPFPTLASQSSTLIHLDTQGTFNTTADDFNGNSVITVSPIPGDIYRKRVLVDVNWTERILGGNIPVHEYLTTDIANEPQLN